MNPLLTITEVQTEQPNHIREVRILRKIWNKGKAEVTATAEQDQSKKIRILSPPNQLMYRISMLRKDQISMVRISPVIFGDGLESLF
ncbi:hypothetical protein D3C80_1960680 [compost metagenome]